MNSDMDFCNEAEKYLAFRPENLIVHEKVDDFFSINRGDIVSLKGSHYLITGIAREKSFGLDEEPKQWVKYAYDLSTGERKILKLIYHEHFDMRYGNHVVHCFRSPAKESLMLESTRGNHCFMQGHTLFSDDAKGVRVIDYIKGKNLFDEIAEYSGSHRRYFRELFPKLLKLFLPCLDALDALHRSGIRADRSHRGSGSRGARGGGVKGSLRSIPSRHYRRPYVRLLQDDRRPRIAQDPRMPRRRRTGRGDCSARRSRDEGWPHRKPVGGHTLVLPDVRGGRRVGRQRRRQSTGPGEGVGAQSS